MRGRAGVLSRRAWALAFVAACATVVALCLGTQSTPVIVRAPFVERPARGPLVAVPLASRPADGGTTVQTITLSTSQAGEIVGHDEVWLFVSPAAGGMRALGAALQVDATACRLESRAAVTLVDGEPLVLKRLPGCAVAVPQRSGRLTLEIRTDTPGTLGLQAHRPRDGSTARGLVLVVEAADAPPLSVRGFRVDHARTAPRVELLNAMWRRSGSTAWLWVILALAVALALAGVVLFPTGPAPLPGAPPSARFAVRCGIGAALLSGSLASLYAVATPPLCAPDEPYHLMGFGDLVGDQQLVDETFAWMRETHQMRIRHHPEERFRTVDVGAPEAVQDPEARPTEAEMRSATGVALWRKVAPALRNAGAPRTLLALRLVNVLFFAGAAGMAAMLVACCAAAPFPQWIVFPIVFVPTLPFFAMHVSETAVLCSIYVVLATSLTVLFLDGPRTHWTGLPLGLACGLILAAGRSPWPLAAVVAAALAARVILGPSGAEHSVRSALVFWTGFALGIAVFRLVLNDAYQQMMLNYTQFVPRAFRPISTPGAFLPLVGAGATLAAGAELALARLRRRLDERLQRPARALAKGAARFLAALVLLSLAASLVAPLPQLALEPPRPLTLGERLGDVLATTATLFRLRDPNFLLGTSFWLGFGWLDAIPDPPVEALLVLLTAAATVALLLGLAAPPQPRRMIWLAFLGAGGVGAMVLYTIVTQALPFTLHGRYLIGWYLIFLSLAACGLTGLGNATQDSPGRLARWLPGVLLVVSGGIHVYCLCFILRRYF